VISMISQARLRRGTNTNRNLPPIKRIIGSWVKKIAMPLKIISFSSYGNILIVLKYVLKCLPYRITAVREGRICSERKMCPPPYAFGGRP
jgi:hypothetical protein